MTAPIRWGDRVSAASLMNDAYIDIIGYVTQTMREHAADKVPQMFGIGKDELASISASGHDESIAEDGLAKYGIEDVKRAFETLNDLCVQFDCEMFCPVDCDDDGYVQNVAGTIAIETIATDVIDVPEAVRDKVIDTVAAIENEEIDPDDIEANVEDKLVDVDPMRDSRRSGYPAGRALAQGGLSDDVGATDDGADFNYDDEWDPLS